MTATILAFSRIAESIISEELAANHYTTATDLQRALGRGKDSMGNGAKVAEMTTIPPKDRRNGEDLLWFVESQMTPTVFFSSEADRKIKTSHGASKWEYFAQTWLCPKVKIAVLGTIRVWQSSRC